MSDTSGLFLHLRDFNGCDASLEAWLVLRSSGLAFEVCCHAGTDTAIHVTPMPLGHLPVLFASGAPVWNSLAIGELIAELQPQLWPDDPGARAYARSFAGEMHQHSMSLRRLLPLDLLGHFSPPGKLTRATEADIRRLVEISEYCSANGSPEGPFLFGEFSIVDAIMTPLAARLITYSIDLQGAAAAYVDALMAWPPMVEWQELASAHAEAMANGTDPAILAESWRIAGDDPAMPVRYESAPAVTVPPAPVMVEEPPVEIAAATFQPPEEIVEEPVISAEVDATEADVLEEEAFRASSGADDPVVKRPDESPFPFRRDPAIDLTIYERPDQQPRPESAERLRQPEPDEPARAIPPEHKPEGPMPPPPKARDLPWIRNEENGAGHRPAPPPSRPQPNPPQAQSADKAAPPPTTPRPSSSTDTAQDRGVSIQPIGAGTRRRR